MRVAIVVLLVGILLASCARAPVVPAAPELPVVEPTLFETATPEPIPTLMPSFTPEPTAAPDLTYQYLVLGVDKGPGRPEAVLGGAGNKTDLMLLVTVRAAEKPMHVTITQFPRNLWVGECETYFLFKIYRVDGFAGMEEYFDCAFGVDLDGVAAVDMETFVAYVDRMGGAEIEGKVLSGAELLAWVRDNDNNWGHGVYDAGMRQHRALVAVLDRAWNKYGALDPITLWATFSKVETDVSLEGFVGIVTIATNGIFQGMSVDYERLAWPDIERGPVPVSPGRAEVPTGDLHAWMAGVVGK